MRDRWSREVWELVHRAEAIALVAGHPSVGTGHLLLALLDLRGWGLRAAELMEVDPKRLRAEIERLLPRDRSPESRPGMGLTDGARRDLDLAGALTTGTIRLAHVFAAVLHGQTGVATRAVVAAAGRPVVILGPSAPSPPRRRTGPGVPTLPEPSRPREEFRIPSCCTDLSTDDLGPVVGREAEIGRLRSVLARRRRGNALVIGEPGVGKTSVVRGLLDGGTRVREFDIPFLIAGTENRGDLEARILHVVGHAWEEDAILFIEDLHILTNDVMGEDAEMVRFCMRRFLDHGNGVLIGSVSPTGYRALREDDPPFVADLQPVYVAPASREESVRVVNAHRGMDPRGSLPADLVPKVVELADLYLADRSLPGSAVDLFDDVTASRPNGKIDEPTLVRVTAERTGIDELTIRDRKPGKSPWL